MNQVIDKSCEQLGLLLKPELELSGQNQQVPAGMPAEIPVKPEKPINEFIQEKKEIHW